MYVFLITFRFGPIKTIDTDFVLIVLRGLPLRHLTMLAALPTDYAACLVDFRVFLNKIHHHRKNFNEALIIMNYNNYMSNFVLSRCLSSSDTFCTSCFSLFEFSIKYTTTQRTKPSSSSTWFQILNVFVLFFLFWFQICFCFYAIFFNRCLNWKCIVYSPNAVLAAI